MICLAAAKHEISASRQRNISDVGIIGQWLLRHVTHKPSSCRTRFKLFRQPSDEDLQCLFDDTAQTAGYNHECVGMTHPVIHSSHIQTGTTNYIDVVYCNGVGSVWASTGLVSTEISDADNFDNWIPDILSFSHNKNFGSKRKGSDEWRTIRIRKTIGYGQECYEAVRDAILSWEKTLPANNQNKPFWASIRLLHYTPEETRRKHSKCHDASSSSFFEIGGSCKKLVTISRSPLGLWTYNPCQVIYDVVDERHVHPTTTGASRGLTYTSTAYATLQGHLLSGEERISVGLHDFPSSKVEVEVLSYSRPTKGPLGKLVFPFIKPMQQRFFQDQVNNLSQIAQQVSSSVDEPSIHVASKTIFAADKFIFGSTSPSQTVSHL